MFWLLHNTNDSNGNDGGLKDIVTLSADCVRQPSGCAIKALLEHLRGGGKWAAEHALAARAAAAQMASPKNEL